MGDDNKKSFWTSLPGILTGVAAVVAAVGGILAAYNHVTPSPPPASPSSLSTTPPPTSPSPTASPQPSSSSSSSTQQFACGTQLPGVTLFGNWEWTKTGHLQSGLLSFNHDCTYTDVPLKGFTGESEGIYRVTSSPPSISFNNTSSGVTTRFFITNSSENSFHAFNTASS